jgi:methylmalonyl-CoA epimerase
MSKSESNETSVALVTLGYQLDHIGHAVANLDEAISRYAQTAGLKVSHRETLAHEGVEVAFVSGPGSAAAIELLAAAPGSTGALARFLEKRGPGLHHICFVVDNIRNELRRLADCGAKLIDQEPREGSRGREIAFVHPNWCGGVLIELCSAPAAR